MLINESLLEPGQKIIYWKNGDYYSQVNHHKKLSLAVGQYLRYYQPFAAVGEQLDMVLGEKIVRTSVIVRAFQSGNSNYFQTINGSRYRVQYIGIDLEKVLEEEKDISSESIFKKFPKDNSSKQDYLYRISTSSVLR